MKLIQRFAKHFNKTKKEHLQGEKDKILNFLYEIQTLEAKLWGVVIKDINTQEEVILEDTNHLIYLYSRSHHKTLKQVLSSKDVSKFLNDLELLKKDFDNLKRKIRKKDNLKLLLSNFTIKLVDDTNYEKFKEVFILERYLYDVLDNQDEELQALIRDVSKVTINTHEEKLELFIDSLKNIRRILAGHIETHNLFTDERDGYSTVSNITFELIKMFRQDIE